MTITSLRQVALVRLARADDVAGRVEQRRRDARADAVGGERDDLDDARLGHRRGVPLRLARALQHDDAVAAAREAARVRLWWLCWL